MKSRVSWQTDWTYFRDGDVGFIDWLDDVVLIRLGVDYGRGAGVGRGLGDGLTLGDAQYLPPLSKAAVAEEPPQTIISLSVQIVVCEARASAALVVLVAVQLSVIGLYLAPVFRKVLFSPPQTIISLPVHTAVWATRRSGTFVLLVAVQVSVTGLYLPPVFRLLLASDPPQTIISLSVHTAV